MRDRSGSEAVTSKVSLESDDKMRGEAQRLRTIFLQLSTRLYIVHQSPYPDVGVGLPLRYPQRSDRVRRDLLYLDVSALMLLQLEKLLQVINHSTLKSLDIGLDIFALS